MATKSDLLLTALRRRPQSSAADLAAELRVMLHALVVNALEESLTRVLHTGCWSEVASFGDAVSDFSAFLGTQPTPHNANARLLLIGVRHGSNAALLVPRMLGLKKPENFVPQADDENFPDWGKQRFSDSEDRLWRKLAVRELLADRTFMNIGI